MPRDDSRVLTIKVERWLQTYRRHLGHCIECGREAEAHPAEDCKVMKQ